jgi:hypothetical protein
MISTAGNAAALAYFKLCDMEISLHAEFPTMGFSLRSFQLRTEQFRKINYLKGLLRLHMLTCVLQ